MEALKPIHDMIDCIVIPETDQTKGGLYLPKSKSLLNQGSLVATVVSVGPNAKEVKPGDKIVFHNSPQWLKHEIEEKVAGKEMKIEHIIISEQNVSSIIIEKK